MGNGKWQTAHALTQWPLKIEHFNIDNVSPLALRAASRL